MYSLSVLAAKTKYPYPGNIYMCSLALSEANYLAASTLAIADGDGRLCNTLRIYRNTCKSPLQTSRVLGASILVPPILASEETGACPFQWTTVQENDILILIRLLWGSQVNNVTFDRQLPSAVESESWRTCLGTANRAAEDYSSSATSRSHSLKAWSFSDAEASSSVAVHAGQENSANAMLRSCGGLNLGATQIPWMIKGRIAQATIGLSAPLHRNPRHARESNSGRPRPEQAAWDAVRRVRCDEQRPKCKSCSKRNVACHYERHSKEALPTPELPSARREWIRFEPLSLSIPDIIKQERTHEKNVATSHENRPDDHKLVKHRQERSHLDTFAVFTGPEIWSAVSRSQHVPQLLKPQGWAVIEAVAYIVSIISELANSVLLN
ncbi:hypothetical protein IF1G_09473 [Cordyceps javanica]|uniref:Zn(2)-C6 fungal-type domain-containing protein n=1 Tax=Cordyceps javanica TaxID=43265 RepID=A0A545UR06_9HYPO|nr:hypothetical protein IF1G_09473 [Cordyceps javanica]